MEWITIIIFLCAFLGILIVASHYYFESENMKWSEYFHQLAETSGLEIQQNEESYYPNLEGNYFGHPTKLEILTIDGCEGVLPNVVVHITVCIKNLPNYTFEIERKNIFSRDRIKIGDPSFEEIFIISSQSEEFASKILASIKLRKKLIDVHFNQLSLKGGKLSMSIKGLDKSHNNLSYCLEVLRDIANILA